MTIFVNFDPSNYANGTKLVDLGWTSYPFVSGDDGSSRRGTITANLVAGSPNITVTGRTGNVSYGAMVHGTGVLDSTILQYDPNASFPTSGILSTNATQTANGVVLYIDEYWRVQNGAIKTDIQQGLNSIRPRILYDTGSTDLRGYTILRDKQFLVILAKDGLNSIRLERNDVRDSNGNVIKSFLLFYVLKNGVNAPAEDYDFPYLCEYNPSLTFYNPYGILPPDCHINWVVSGNKMKLYIDGVLQKVRRRDVYDPNVTEMILPSFMVGSTMVGYHSPFGSDSLYAYPLIARDNNSLIVVNGPSPVRATNSTSSIRVTGTCNISGATSIRVRIWNGATLLSNTTGNITSGNFTVISTPIARVNENILLRLEITNIGGTLDTQEINYVLPTTVISGEAIIGQNESSASYYSGIWPFNDLAKALNWRVRNRFVLPPDVNPAYYAVGYDLYYPASYIGMTAKGSPTKFPDDPTDTVLQQMPYYPEIGDYVLDMRQCPNLQWKWTGVQSVFDNLETYLDYYGTNIHRIRVKSTDMQYWGIEFTRDPTKPNGGMPTTDWILTCKRAGTTDDMVWSQEYLDWIGASGIRFMRYMSSQIANEPAINRQWDVFTAANRVKMTDQYWTAADLKPTVPTEAIVQLHNKVKIDIWDNISRLCDETYVRARAAYYRDNLDPDLKIVWATSNEVWNFAFRQYFGYNLRGFAQGLGKPDAIYGADNGSYVYPEGGFPSSWVATTNYAVNAQVGYGGHIYRAKVSITGSGGNPNPQTDTARWEIFQLGHIATYRAHINQFRLMRSWIVDEFGGEQAAKERCLFVCEGHHTNFEAQIPEYITWGHNWQFIDAIATGPYFGGSNFDGANWNALSTGVKNSMSLTGAPRIALWKTEAMTEALKQADFHNLNAGKLANMVIADGGQPDSVEFWQYEGGQHFLFNFNNAVLNAAGQASVDQELLRQDVLKFYKEELYDIYIAYYERMIEGCGGRIGHFDSFIAYRLYYKTPQNAYQFWGVSGDAMDRAETSSRYRAIRDLSLDNGGELKDFTPVVSSKRRRLIIT